ncbi:MAG: hypothetical protein LKH33_08650 [Acetobacter sp.]|nr:hypothetical protein [Acetobacter sp.]MCI1485864.1 hypothetical protein [Acetobacter sp.]MCI1529754.1 hypothetical protein [Acetobacter sp.]MCI1587577.1 hypothetical protein [Acetobacter sp.]MCI1601794.1 hypothetical protein [Acetobacter sp.]
MTSVRLSPEERERIIALVGDRGMAQFIREAVEKELRRREQTLRRQGDPPSDP